MGSLRGIGQTDITVSASPPLPRKIRSRDISLVIPARFSRNATGLGTDYLPIPTFSPPRILEHGALVAFTLCVDARHIDAGSYVGQVIVGGPPGVQPATVAITVNAKDKQAFTIGLIGAALIAILLLALRATKANYDAIPPPQNAGANPSPGQKLSQAWKAFVLTAFDLFGFWVPTAVALAAAIVAMLQVYDGNPGWGADPTVSLIALGSTAITAAGIGTFLSSLRGS